jgi:organic radical activating enzyme
MSKVFEIQDYYCSMKFKFLKIDLESKTTYNCHAAQPHAVDFKWLGNNPGNLFNTDINVAERQMMLENKRNPSCEQNCWSAEDLGIQSPRQYQSGISRTHFNVNVQPEIIDITIGADCNLTCSYCCKEYSTAWRRDIVVNGDYAIDNHADRYQATDKDRILLKISQPELKHSSQYQQLMQEVELAAPELKKLVVTGGEPLLDNFLIDTMNRLKMSKQSVIEVYTGLGVSESRFAKIVQQLKQVANLTMIISAETVGKHAEFNRYGIQWKEFLHKIDLLKQNGIKIKFQSTITNLTVFGFAEFYNLFKEHDIILTFAHQPTMMSAHVLDHNSKQHLTQQLEVLPAEFSTPLLQSLEPMPTDMQRTDIRNFLTEFTARRQDLNLNIFPKTFIEWLGLDHVV